MQASTRLEENTVEIYHLIENLLSYCIIYPRTALRLKDIIRGEEEDGYIQHIVRMTSHEEMFIDSQQLQDMLEILIENFGKIDTITGKKLEEHVLKPSIDEKEELEKRLEECNISIIFQSIIDYSLNEDNETIDRNKLNSLWRTWDNLFSLAGEDEHNSEFKNIIQKLPKIKTYFERAKPTPSQIEYFNLAIEDIDRYLEITEHAKWYNQFVKLMDVPDPSQVPILLSPFDSEEENVEVSRKKMEFSHSIFWLLGSQLLKEKYFRISKFWEDTDPDQQLCKPIDKLSPPNPHNLFPGDIADVDRGHTLGITGPSIIGRLELEKAKAEARYRTLQQSGGLEFLLLHQKPKKNTRTRYLNNNNNKDTNIFRDNGGFKIL